MMRRIYCAASLPEAYLLLHRLRWANIAARVFNENAQGGVGELPFTHAYPEVWIENDGDESRALSVVGEFEARSDCGNDLTCVRCGETNPSTFETCWKCSSPLDDRGV